jgi:hypothetical protein
MEIKPGQIWRLKEDEERGFGAISAAVEALRVILIIDHRPKFHMERYGIVLCNGMIDVIHQGDLLRFYELDHKN